MFKKITLKATKTTFRNENQMSTDAFIELV